MNARLDGLFFVCFWNNRAHFFVIPSGIDNAIAREGRRFDSFSIPFHMNTTERTEENTMRITIDTELQAIIVPDSYYMQVDKLNEIITSANGTALDYEAYIKTCFDKAYETQIVRQSDVAKLKPHKKVSKGKAKPEDEKFTDKTEAEGESK